MDKETKGAFFLKEIAWVLKEKIFCYDKRLRKKKSNCFSFRFRVFRNMCFFWKVRVLYLDMKLLEEKKFSYMKIKI